MLAFNCYARFPTVPITDDANRADDTDVATPADVDWGQVANADEVGISSNVFYATGTSPYGYAGVWWDGGTDATYQDLDIYATIATKSSDDSDMVLSFRGNSTNLLTVDGYSIAVDPHDGGDDEIDINEITNGATTDTVVATDHEVSNGYAVGARVVGSTFWLFWNTGSGWTYLGTGTNTTYSAAGVSAIVLTDTTGRVDDFATGDYTPRNPVLTLIWDVLIKKAYAQRQPAVGITAWYIMPPVEGGFSFNPDVKPQVCAILNHRREVEGFEKIKIKGNKWVVKVVANDKVIKKLDRLYERLPDDFPDNAFLKGQVLQAPRRLEWNKEKQVWQETLEELPLRDFRDMDMRVIEKRL